MRVITFILAAITCASCVTETLFIYEPAPVRGTIVRWIDGDTCEIKIREGWREKVRIWGIDTPERNQPGFNQATQNAIDTWPFGSSVTLNYPETKSDGSTRYRDNFGRLLATLSRGKP